MTTLTRSRTQRKFYIYIHIQKVCVVGEGKVHRFGGAVEERGYVERLGDTADWQRGR